MNDYHQSNKVKLCKCGSRLCLNDSHVVCERYLEEIRQGIKEQQDIIDELQNGEML